jgi:hypothetical protein
VRDLPAGDREPVLLRRGVELAEQRAAADAHGPRRRVDLDVVERAQVEAHRPVPTERPETECEPPRTVNGVDEARAARTAAATSSASVAWATAAGRRSMAPFQPARAAS